MKIYLALLFCLFLQQLFANSLSFDKLELSTTLDVDKEHATLVFKYTNHSQKDIVIKNLSAGCDGCLKAEIVGGNMTVAAGKSGTLKATFKAASYTGSVKKGISLWTGASAKGKPTTTLICNFEIPKMVSTKLRRISWTGKESNTAKSLTFKTATNKPFPKTTLTCSDPNFSSKLTWDTAKSEYQLKVTAKDTTVNYFAVITIKTGLNATRNKAVRFYLLTKP